MELIQFGSVKTSFFFFVAGKKKKNLEREKQLPEYTKWEQQPIQKEPEENCKKKTPS